MPNMDELDAIDWNIMLVCGRSGSGKSTIMRMLGGVKDIVYDSSIPVYPVKQKVIM